MSVPQIVLLTSLCSKRGLILNIGSFAGSVPSPMLATYSGTKAFLSTFTSALAEEVTKDNITVEHVNTYFVVRNPYIHAFYSHLELQLHILRCRNSPKFASRP